MALPRRMSKLRTLMQNRYMEEECSRIKTIREIPAVSQPFYENMADQCVLENVIIG